MTKKMKQVFTFYCLWLVFGLNSTLYSQVSSMDRKLFADNLNAGRKMTNLGVSPYSNEYISIVFNDIKYSGVRAASNELMLKAYPNISYATLLNLFNVMSVNETVLNQFLYQVCLYNEGDKNQIIKSLKSFCSNEQLATRIYTKYWGKFSNELMPNIAKNKTERNQIDRTKSKENYKSIFDSDEDSTTRINTPVKDQLENEYEAEFPGGETAYRNFLQKNLKIPDSAVDISGIVIIEFTIDTSGKVGNAKVISKPLGHGLENEVLRVISMLPRWIPARKYQVSINSIRTQSFVF